MRSEAAAVAEAAAAHAPRPQSKHSLLTSFYYYSRWLPSWRALRRGARLLLPAAEGGGARAAALKTLVGAESPMRTRPCQGRG
eukprot:scaffold22764_cov66-Phaeocystis_antarctica.AAC.1